MKKGRNALPWWLEVGTELCPNCHQLYLYETEYRCADCDAPMCDACIRVRESVTIVCGPCDSNKTTKAAGA